MLQVEQRCPNHPDWLVVTWRAAGGFGENRNNEEIAKLAEYDLRIEWDQCREGCKAVKDPTTLRVGCEAKRQRLAAQAEQRATAAEAKKQRAAHREADKEASAARKEAKSAEKERARLLRAEQTRAPRERGVYTGDRSGQHPRFLDRMPAAARRKPPSAEFGVPIYLSGKKAAWQEPGGALSPTSNPYSPLSPTNHTAMRIASTCPASPRRLRR